MIVRKFGEVVRKRMRVGVIVDRLQVTAWQAEALRSLGSEARFIIYNCTNSEAPRRRLRHAGYYLLRLLSLNLRIMKSVPFPSDLHGIATFDFQSGNDGAWQTLPAHLLNRMQNDAPEVLLKFGMGLLRVPSHLAIPILSYHHGDPRDYRGRPAGFYELLHRQTSVGQVVQRLTDRLDAGAVLAYGETKALAHSWRATMAEAFARSPLLLLPAVRNAKSGISLPLVPAGRNYRLPSNRLVLRFVLGRMSALARRIAYGLFFEKAWRIAEAHIGNPASLMKRFPDRGRWRVIGLPRRYHFIADPFYASSEILLAEAFRGGRGEIVQVSDGALRPVTDYPGHLSYPATLSIEGETLVVPEMAEWAAARLFRFRSGRLEEVGELDFGRPLRLIDPTMFSRDGKFYLFGNIKEESLSVLRLWVSEAALGPWREHPKSPIRISPAGSRMGGSILSLGSKLVRTGQDLRGGYGDGVLFFELIELSPTAYEECAIGELRFNSVRGPHTINISGGKILFDFYNDRFSPAAGLSRLRSWIAARRRERLGTASDSSHRAHPWEGA